jgi:hypothetical protein
MFRPTLFTPPLACVLVLASWTVPSTPARAAEPGPVEEIVVSATRMQVPVSALPSTFEVIGRAALDVQAQIGGSAVDAVAALVPSFLKQPAEWHPNGRSSVRLGARGEIVEVRDALRDSLAERVFNTLYPLHAAHVGGRAYDAVVAATGLVLATLALLGGATFLSWQLRRGRPSRTPLQPAPATEALR